MAKFNEAVYRYKDVNRLIPLNEIAHESDFNQVRRHLFCPGRDCQAQLDYVRRGDGSGYLRKLKSSEHAPSCDYFDIPTGASRPESEYVHINGSLSSDAINERKRRVQEALRKYLHPEEQHSEKTVSNTKRKRNQVDPALPKESIVSVDYDPDAPVVDNQDKSIRMQGPAFYLRYPNQFQESDSNKNLKTFAKIQSITIAEDGLHAQIEGEFEGTHIFFQVPEAFFNSSNYQIFPDQVMSFLTIVRDFVQASDTSIYLTTMCQSGRLDMNHLEVSILDYDFLGFAVNSGDTTYPNLSAVAAVISTGALK